LRKRDEGTEVMRYEGFERSVGSKFFWSLRPVSQFLNHSNPSTPSSPSFLFFFFFFFKERKKEIERERELKSR
jgi:hypothetical protein